jgi:hypothetical protein
MTKESMNDKRADENWIAVPTYWTHSTKAPGEEPVVFDHPEPLDGQGTLSRTLESFRELDGDFSVLVVAAGAHPGLGDAVARRVRELIAPWSDAFPLYLAAPPDVARINGLLGEPFLALDSYGSIRNVQLFIPYMLGARMVMGIDDDEIVENRDHVAKALEWIGLTHGGKFVGGMAGPYFDRQGEYRIEGAEALGRHGNVFVMKNHYMNEGLKKAMQAPRPDGIVKSNMAFGGNMCMARETIANVCHDPFIPRGEDYDYVVNAAMRGFAFFFRPDMGITHLPPDSTGSQAGDKMSKLAADIWRFIYMREKYWAYARRWPEQCVPIEDLMPYPGVYFEPSLDLRRQGVEALNKLYPEFRERGDPEIFVEEAASVARAKAEEFFVYQERWSDVLKNAGAMAHMENTLRGLRIG